MNVFKVLSKNRSGSLFLRVCRDKFTKLNKIIHKVTLFVVSLEKSCDIEFSDLFVIASGTNEKDPVDRIINV